MDPADTTKEGVLLSRARAVDRMERAGLEDVGVQISRIG